MFQLPGLWVPEAVAVVTRKAEWVGWWSQGEVNNVVTAKLQSCLELVAVCPLGFSAVAQLGCTKFTNTYFWIACLFAYCTVVFYLNTAAKLPTICMLESIPLQWLYSLHSINPWCCVVLVHDGEGLLFFLHCKRLLLRILSGVPLLFWGSKIFFIFFF